MPFGELFTGTFGQIWRHKRLWLFGLLGLTLTSIGLLIYQIFQYRWQGEWFSTMGDMTQESRADARWVLQHHDVHDGLAVGRHGHLDGRRLAGLHR